MKKVNEICNYGLDRLIDDLNSFNEEAEQFIGRIEHDCWKREIIWD